MERFQSKRVWLGGGAVAALLVVAVGWFMFIGPELSSAGDLRAQATETRQQNSVSQAKVKALQVKSTQLAKYTGALKAALSAVPADSGLPAFTRQLSAQASALRVSVGSVVVGGVSAVTDAASAAATTPTAGTTGAASDSSTTTAAPATSVAPTSVSAAGSLFAVQVTVTSSGTLAHQLEFLKDIRTAGPRRALITSVQVAPGTGTSAASIDGSTAFTTQLTIFSAPQSPAQLAALKKLLSGKIGN